jgi:hypothetical protein
MNPFRLPACAIGIHHRDRKSVWRDGVHYRSVCAGCGTPLVRHFNRWRPSREPDG